jgi:hypothetical protein
METETKIRNFLKEIEELASLASEDLLKSDKFYNTKEKIEDELKELGKKLEEREQLSIEKIVPIWRNVRKPSFFMNPDSIKEILPLRDLLLKLLTKYGEPQSLPTPKNEIIINIGEQYEGKKYLRSIFNQAESSLFIKDNYLKAEILDILSEYIIDKPKLNIRIMVLENKNLTALRVHYSAFIAQYPGSLEVKYLSKEEKDHPRYILVDGCKLFTPDHSLDQWGISTVNIYEHTNQKEIEDVKQSLEKNWEKGVNL